MSAFNSVTRYPAMLANQLAATHTNWIGFGTTLLVLALTRWMGVLTGMVPIRPEAKPGPGLTAPDRPAADAAPP